ncbi:SEC12-like protein 2 isoform X2 [Durio zibethinus]|uniref:SEC12-like protein 2 isoform X2 n=1 Tax=Durio zibethinus TaxID=66656 RepID=A0A6P6BH44_DURZI|nr:SEC12-like protein 2 isoform X2 [Durio zibethinus]
MTDTLSDLQKYGVPFYGSGWVPYNHVRSKVNSQEKHEDDEEDNKEDEDPTQSEEEEISTSLNYVVLAGGGGEGRSGIPNAIVVSHVDFASNSLSDQPVVKLGTGSDLPYRMTVHPRGDGVICAMQQSCRLFEWEEPEDNEVHKLGVKGSEKVLTQLEDVGQQLALTFNSEGSVLAAGGEDGSLRVFKWPSMEIILNEAQAHSSVKSLDFSCDGKFLVSLGSSLCRIWDVTSSKVIASLAKGNDEVFAICRFSQIVDKNPVLYIAAVTDHGGSILTWNTTTWKRMHANRVVREPISAFNVSADGKFLAVALISASLDSSARVTLIKDKTKSGGMSWLIIFMVLLAIAVYFMKEKGIIP